MKYTVGKLFDVYSLEYGKVNIKLYNFCLVRLFIHYTLGAHLSVSHTDM